MGTLTQLPNKGLLNKVMIACAFLAGAQPALAQTVLERDFSYTMTLPDGDTIGESGTVVPLVPGTCYNWRLRLSKTKGAVDITEIYRLPKAPKTWEIGPYSDVVVAADKRSATSELSLTPVDSWIGNDWCVSRGDPAGDYSFEIKSGARVLAEFSFRLEKY